VVCARLLHEDLQGVLAALAGMSVPAGGKEANGLDLLLTVWLRSVKEIRARRARNVSVSALCRLHTRCTEDEQLRSLRPGGANEPLAEQLLAAIVQGLEFENERCRKLREAKHLAVDSDEEDDDDDDEEIDDDDDGRQGLKGGMLLSELLDLEDLDDSDGDEGGDTFHQLEQADPLASLDVRQVALEHLAQHGGAAGRPELVSRIASALAEACGPALAETGVQAARACGGAEVEWYYPGVCMGSLGRVEVSSEASSRAGARKVVRSTCHGAPLRWG